MFRMHLEHCVRGSPNVQDAFGALREGALLSWLSKLDLR